MAGEGQYGCIVDSLSLIPGGLPVANELGSAITNAPGNTVITGGTYTFYNSFASEDRNYPVNMEYNYNALLQPINNQAVIKIINQPREGLDDWRGQNGFAILVEQGIAKFDGPIWGTVKFMEVTGTGTQDSKYYIDGIICDDAWGNGSTGQPFRVFTPNEASVPSTGDVIGVIGGGDGTFYPVIPTTSGSARRCNAVVDGTLDYSSTSGNVRTVQPIDGGTSPGSTLTGVYNMGFGASDGASCKIEWNVNESRWEFYSIAPEVISVVSDFQVDAANKVLQIKTKDLLVWYGGVESGWTTKHTGDECA